MKVDNTINSRTPEEIKKGLECCIAHTSCDMCPYLGTNNCMAVNTADALAYIQQLEEDRKERDILADAYQRAVERLKDFSCSTCKYEEVAVNAEPCQTCFNSKKWEFDGVQEVE